MKEDRATIKFEPPCKVIKNPKWYLASCYRFDVHSQGDTETEARDNLKEALSLFLPSCYERGTLDAVLKNAASIL